jgi:hypothetical protein
VPINPGEKVPPTITEEDEARVRALIPLIDKVLSDKFSALHPEYPVYISLNGAEPYLFGKHLTEGQLAKLQQLYGGWVVKQDFSREGASVEFTARNQVPQAVQPTAEVIIAPEILSEDIQRLTQSLPALLIPSLFIYHSENETDAGFSGLLAECLKQCGAKSVGLRSEMPVGATQGWLHEQIEASDLVIFVCSIFLFEQDKLLVGMYMAATNRVATAQSLQRLPLVLDDELFVAENWVAADMRRSTVCADFRGWLDKAEFLKQFEKLLRVFAPKEEPPLSRL